MEWNRKIEDKLTQNWQWLMRTVMLKEIVHVLIEDKIVTLDFWMHLKEKQISEQDRNANFFFEVSKFTMDRYNQFIQALKKGGHGDLAKMLEIDSKDAHKISKSLGPKNERIKKTVKTTKPPEFMSKQERTPSDIKRENSELRNHLTTITSQVGQLHNVTQNLTGTLLPKDATFIAETDMKGYGSQIQITEHKKYLELQDINTKQEIAIKHLRSEILDLKIDLNHQINQLEIKLKDAQVKKDLKEQEADNLLSKVTGIKTQMHRLSKELDNEREEKTKLKVESARLAKINGELHEKNKEQSSKVVSLENSVLQLTTEKQSATAEVKRLQEHLSEKEKLLVDKKQEISDILRKTEEINSKGENLERENKSLETKVREFEKQILDLNAKIRRLEEEKQRTKLKSSVVPSWRY